MIRARLLSLMLLCATLLALPWAARAQAERRVALVVGNAGYKSSPLKNSVNDARAMRSKLKSMGFEVVYFENLQTRQVGQALREFRNAIKPGSVALFFYAGHGLQVRGENYLPAVDAQLASEEDVPNQSLSLSAVLATMEDSKAGVNLVLLDACRNNPYARSFRSAPQGLARVQAPSGTLIHYATRPGSVAEDGRGTHGTYTEALLSQIDEKGVPIETALKRVAIRVRDATKGKQEPWMEGSLTGDFYFVNNAQFIVQQAPANADAAAWQAADSVRSAAAYQAYLSEYPSGLYAAAARVKLAGLGVKPAAPSTAAALAPAAVVATAPAARPAENIQRTQEYQLPAAEREALRTAAVREMRMTRLTGADFLMGADAEEPGEDGQPDSVAQPQHGVTILNFEMGTFEVTVGQFRKFVQATGHVTEAEGGAQPGCLVPGKGGRWALQPSAQWRAPGYPQTDAHPVVCVSWNDVQAYLQWLNGEGRERFRLPSEAEWEFAARGGTTTPRPWVDEGGFFSSMWDRARQGAITTKQPPNRACKFANVADEALRAQLEWVATVNCRDGFPFASPSGKAGRNAVGLFDMIGNAAEWTQDCWNPNHAGASRDGLPRTAGDCTSHALRGGSWASSPSAVRSAARVPQDQSYRAADVGFRLARTPAPK